MMHENITVITAFLFGLLSFISPCVLPLIPAYISYIMGMSMEDLKDSNKRKRKSAFIRSLMFVLGFSLIFVLLGAAATAVGGFLLEKLRLIMKFAGVLIVLFGLHITGLLKIKWLYFEKRMNMNTRSTSLIGVFLMGMAFAFGWTPCIGPILSTILVVAGTRETVGQGILLLSVYSLGLGIPFILTALALDRFLSVFEKLKKYFRVIEIISGVLLIIVGVLIFFGSLDIIAQMILRVFPWLGNIG